MTGCCLEIPLTLGLLVSSPGARISIRDDLGRENIGTPVVGSIKPLTGTPIEGVCE